MEAQKKRPFIKKTPLSFDRWEIWITLRRILGIQIKTVKTDGKRSQKSHRSHIPPVKQHFFTKKTGNVLTKWSKSFSMSQYEWH